MLTKILSIAYNNLRRISIPVSTNFSIYVTSFPIALILVLFDSMHN